MTRRLSTVLAVLGLLLAACGDDDDADEASQSTTTTTTAPDDGGDEGDGGGDTADGATVTIVDFAFEPSTTEVGTGSAVTWTNEDAVTHTVTAGEPGAAEQTFDESLDSGGSAEIVFDEAGTFPYFCSIHPDMTGEVVVS